MNTNAFGTRIISGAIGGLLASIPMWGVMAGIKRRSAPLPPRLITMRMLRRFHATPPRHDATREAIALAAHLGYGAAAGAAYGPISRLIPLPGLLRGAFYGAAVWAGSYAGWLPVAGIHAPPAATSRRQNGAILAGHLVWGMLLSVVHDYAAPRVVQKAPIGARTTRKLNATTASLRRGGAVSRGRRLTAAQSAGPQRRSGLNSTRVVTPSNGVSTHGKKGGTSPQRRVRPSAAKRDRSEKRRSERAE
jgi:uncharacterized membrane protein YagU involved in acid resistance